MTLRAVAGGSGSGGGAISTPISVAWIGDSMSAQGQ
jgi:hypothetical protein